VTSTSLVLEAGREPQAVEFERALVAFFLDAAEMLGVPKSVAAIYGVCFASPLPLSFADIEERLDISKGSISQPSAAIRNNVLGTRQLARIACAHGVDAFVFISTDKAINPTSVMGATKRLAEIQLMAIAATQTVSAPAPLEAASVPANDGRELAAEQLLALEKGAISAGAWRRRKPTKFMAVRFGNVLGSSGSVIPIFKRQIANGGPVTVTHPEVTRYFMTIPEAVGLVLQSFVQGEGGEIFVLDMGQPVKIVDLARQMIELSGFRVGDDIEIKFTGLKPGEKLFEELQHQTEEYTATAHPRIMRFTSTAMFSESGIQELEQQLYKMDSNGLKSVLQRLVPEYTPFLD
jgi:FlaA1/EpsC-like NDP-sugar epimerase